jgi:hypothetical protein
MRFALAAGIVGVLLSVAPANAETPCDFKGVSVGSKMMPAEIMSTLGVAQYKTNPARYPFEKKTELSNKYGLYAAAEIEEAAIGPFCDERSCVVPYGIGVGNASRIPVKVFVAIHDGQVIEMEVSFSEMNWDEVRPIFYQKYGGDWKIERDDMVVSNYEDKKARTVQRISLEHIADGVNRSTHDRCKISATNVDVVFEHHDSLGPYHSQLVITLISKNF